MKCDLVLDTCVFLWLVTCPEVLTGNARRAIEDAALPALSAISLVEIHRLLRAKKIRLPCTDKSLKRWYDRAHSHHGIVDAPVTSEVAHTAERLPFHHKDPADRFILATARLNQCPLVSPDGLFSHYRQRVIW